MAVTVGFGGNHYYPYNERIIVADGVLRDQIRSGWHEHRGWAAGLAIVDTPEAHAVACLVEQDTVQKLTPVHCRLVYIVDQCGRCVFIGSIGRTWDGLPMFAG